MYLCLHIYCFTFVTTNLCLNKTPKRLKHFIEIDDTTLGGQELFGLIKSFLAMSENNAGIKITGPLETAAILVERNDFLEDLLNELPIEMGILDKDGRYIYMNKKAISKPERRAWVIGKTDEEYSREYNFRTDLQEKRSAAFRKACETGKEVSWFEEFEMPNGSTKHYIRRYAPIYTKDSDFSYLIGYGLDITIIKQAEVKILEAKKTTSYFGCGVIMIIFFVATAFLAYFFGSTGNLVENILFLSLSAVSYFQTDLSGFPRERGNRFAATRL